MGRNTEKSPKQYKKKKPQRNKIQKQTNNLQDLALKEMLVSRDELHAFQPERGARNSLLERKGAVGETPWLHGGGTEKVAEENDLECKVRTGK